MFTFPGTWANTPGKHSTSPARATSRHCWGWKRWGDSPEHDQRIILFARAAEADDNAWCLRPGRLDSLSGDTRHVDLSELRRPCRHGFRGLLVVRFHPGGHGRPELSP